MTSANFGETIIGEATMAACDLLAQQISQQCKRVLLPLPKQCMQMAGGG
jgi:hypothetical protein